MPTLEGTLKVSIPNRSCSTKQDHLLYSTLAGFNIVLIRNVRSVVGIVLVDAGMTVEVRLVGCVDRVEVGGLVVGGATVTNSSSAGH